VTPRFHIVNVRRLIDQVPESRICAYLSFYSCPLNGDVEDFLINKSVDFAKQGIAQTHLVFNESDDAIDLVGFFALTIKTLNIPAIELTRIYQKRAGKFGVLTKDNCYSIPMPLIAQFGKNFSPNISINISGDELLKIACDKVKALQMELGGRFLYLECENRKQLIDFYEANGFRRISPETDSVRELVQLLKYQ